MFSLEAVGKEKKILFVSLYLLIWGEAANIRFLPECLCYIFHHVSLTWSLIFVSCTFDLVVGPCFVLYCAFKSSRPAYLLSQLIFLTFILVFRFFHLPLWKSGQNFSSSTQSWDTWISLWSKLLSSVFLEKFFLAVTESN